MPKPSHTPVPDTLPAPAEPETLPELPAEPEPEPAHPQPHCAKAAEAKGRGRKHGCKPKVVERQIDSFYFAVSGVPVDEYRKIRPGDLANTQVVPCKVPVPVSEAEVPAAVQGRIRSVRMKLGPFEHHVPRHSEDGGGLWSFFEEGGKVVVRPELPAGAELEVEYEEGADG